ncbi:MAG: DUF502 domain-containing protein [Phycisphaerae bacterium]
MPTGRGKPTLGRHLRSAFLTGLITIFPLFVTIYFLNILFGLATKFSQPAATALVKFLVGLYAAAPAFGTEARAAYDAYVNYIAGWASPFLALIISAAVVYLLGILGTFVLGKRILAAGEHFIENLPLIKGIYGTTKQVIQVFRQGGGGQGFQRVVLVEFPRVGTWTIGFVTNTISDASTNTPYVCVFIPMTPNPTSGFFQMFPLDQVHDTDWSVDQGIKIILSGGLLAPPELHFGPQPK